MTSATGTGKYEELLARCRGHEPVPTAVAHPCDETSLAGAIGATRLGLITPILVGPRARILAIAAAHGIDLAGIEIVDAPHSHAAAAQAVALVREGRAELLMKGSLHTDELLGAVVDHDTGLRTGRRLSHVFIMDVPNYHKVLMVTDGAINIAPRLEDKLDICQNAIDLAIALGVRQPKVAILAAVETVSSRMPATIDAACLCKMAERGQIRGARWPSIMPSAARPPASRGSTLRWLATRTSCWHLTWSPATSWPSNWRSSATPTVPAWCWARGYPSS
jgi:phosphotransacetylase